VPYIRVTRGRANEIAIVQPHFAIVSCKKMKLFVTRIDAMGQLVTVRFSLIWSPTVLDKLDYFLGVEHTALEIRHENFLADDVHQ